MKITHYKKSILTALILFPLLLAACTNQAVPETKEEEDLSSQSAELNLTLEESSAAYPESSLEAAVELSITLEEVSSRAAGYYPEEVTFQFVRHDKLKNEHRREDYVNQSCYLFDVLYEGKKVSGVAVGEEDGSVWILDMGNEELWLSEEFMGLTREKQGEAGESESEPTLVLYEADENSEETGLYFAGLNTIPEFSNSNEGRVTWNETDKTLTFIAIKATGSVTGAVDGPVVKAVVSWEDGKPKLQEVHFEPAPIFSQPGQVLLSGEVMDIEEERLIEIGEYLKDLWKEVVKKG